MRGTMRYRDGNWRLQVYAGTDEATGKKRWKSRTVRAPNNRVGKRLAEEELSKLVTEVVAGQYKAGDDIRVAELLERWFNARRADWSPGTVYQYRRLIDGRIVPRIGNQPAHKVRGVHLDALYAGLRARGGQNGAPLAAGTVKKVHVVLHSAFAQAVRWGIVAVNPADVAQAPATDETEIVPPDSMDVARAFAQAAQADPELAVFLRIAAATGARRGQVCALRWSDVDLDAGAITFARALIDGGPGVGVVEKSTKTKLTYSVAIDAGTRAAIAEHRRAHVARCLAAGLPSDGYVFVRRGNLPWRPDTTSKRWRDVRAVVGLDTVRLHDFRHYMITELLAAGVDVRTVAGRAGQANPNLTLKRYGHFVVEKDREAAEVMGRLMGDV